MKGHPVAWFFLLSPQPWPEDTDQGDHSCSSLLVRQLHVSISQLLFSPLFLPTGPLESASKNHSQEKKRIDHRFSSWLSLMPSTGALFGLGV